MMAATVTPLDRYVPLIRDGNGWSTSIMLVNLGTARAAFQLSFLRAVGQREAWKLAIKAPGAEVAGQSLTASLQPGAALTVQTGGAGSTLVQGYAQLSVFGEGKVGGSARVTGPTSSFAVPLSPEYEKRSVVALDLTDGSAGELVLVSGTSSAFVEMVFRDESGKELAGANAQFGKTAKSSSTWSRCSRR